MALIYETKNFFLESAEKPHVSREDGGHIRIWPKVKVVNRQALSPKLAIELARLESVAGEAFANAMNSRGIDVCRINYQDMGNWTVFDADGPKLHVQLYGRAKSAKVQKWGESVYLPLRKTNPEFYANFKPLNAGDVEAIQKEIKKLFSLEKYSDKNWGLD